AVPPGRMLFGSIPVAKANRLMSEAPPGHKRQRSRRSRVSPGHRRQRSGRSRVSQGHTRQRSQYLKGSPGLNRQSSHRLSTVSPPSSPDGSLEKSVRASTFNRQSSVSSL